MTDEAKPGDWTEGQAFLPEPFDLYCSKHGKQPASAGLHIYHPVNSTAAVYCPECYLALVDAHCEKLVSREQVLIEREEGWG